MEDVNLRENSPKIALNEKNNDSLLIGSDSPVGTSLKKPMAPFNMRGGSDTSLSSMKDGNAFRSNDSPLFRSAFKPF
jgi:hypothetical protein